MDPAEALRAVVAEPGDRAARARRLAEAIREARGYRWVGIYDVGSAEISAVGWSGMGEPAHPRFPAGEGLCGAAARGGKPVVVPDVRSDPRYLTTFGSTRSEIVVPVHHGGVVRGLIDVESDRADAFSAEDSAFLDACGQAIAPLWEGRR